MNIVEYNKIYKKEIPELFTNTIHNICNKDYTKEQLNAWANPIIDYNFWEKRLVKTKPFLSIKDKQLIGFAEFYEDYIDCFYVHSDFQGLGVGKKLLNHILNLAKQKEIKMLKVDASITAKPFFESFGFKVIRENKVKRDNQELINFSMIKDLS